MIGKRIKMARTASGISQTDLAKRVGISKQTLYKYETGVITNIPSDKIEAISGILRVTPAFLMGWEESRGPISEEIVFTDHEVDLVLKYRQADDGTRSAVCKLLDVPGESIVDASAG